MTKLYSFLSPSTVTVMGVLTLASVASISRPAVAAQFYQQINLVTDNQTQLAASGFTPAANVDPNLVNPWGISFSPTGPFWISDNGTGLTTLYNGAGVKQSLVVTIPPPGGSAPGTTSAPTGQIFNSTPDFVISKGSQSNKSLFLFATEDGTISGWNPTVDPKGILAYDNSASGAVYKGLAFGSNSSGNFLYAANFNSGKIDVLNKNFNPVNLSGSFTDPNIPTGFAPFNIQNIGGQLYVTYAKQNAAKHDDVAGAGNGFLDVFDTNGNLIKHAVSNGSLDSPWGLALAPTNFGQFSNDLLVGNFGDGKINAFDPNNYAYLGQVKDANGNPITIDGLWGLAFGNGGNAGKTNQLFFTAGINHEANGLFGQLVSVPEPSTMSLFSLGLVPAIALLRRRKKN